MKLSIFIFFFIHVCCWSFGQQDTKLPGLVVEQNSKFNTGAIKYISNAQIKSPGAQPQLSAANGSFALVFADKPGGNMARIYVSKSGYETVNDQELKRAAVLGRKSPLKIVLCKEGQLYQNQMAYYQIAKDAAKESYDKRMAILKKEGKEKDLLITDLQLKFKQEISSVSQANELLLRQLLEAELRAQELADKWIAINLDDQSDAYQRAFKAFLAKDIDAALSILEEVDLEKRLTVNATEKDKEKALLEEVKESIETREIQIQQDIEQCVFKARLHILKYEFGKVEELYELALQFDSTNSAKLV